jgi:phosphopantothenoylcysteine decarboxylase/phosphopantothenate--cysteine ligase
VRHISLAKNSDYIIIAPATADLLARLAMGRADDLLTNVFLASKAPKMIVPAMHPQMWKNEATVANVATLRARGITVLDPDTGALTSGDVGQGRFPETQRIISEFELITSRAKDFLGKRVLVTAGGTREPIDPVRFIGNNSSGKQGYAIARSALNRGGEVTLIAANSTLADIDGVRMIKVGTAAEMHAAVLSEFPQCDVLVMSAAVADAKPMHQDDSKIKKSDFTSIELTENEDILKSVAKMKSKQIIIAFAAETSHDEAQAREKLSSKGADILYLNDVSQGDIFNSETTYGEIFIKGAPSHKVSKTTKDTLGEELLNQALVQLG